MPVFFKRLSIRYRLLISYSLAFICIMTLSFVLIYSLVKSTLESNIENELKNSTSIIHGMVVTAIDASTRNHLRSIAESYLAMATTINHQALIDGVSDKKARKTVSEIILNQTIGESGYIYCIDSKGTVRVHPKTELIGTNLMHMDFVAYQAREKQGYLEYDWANPGEKEKRPKAVYMSYFEPWDWIICVSSYRHEFNRLISVNDFKQNIQSLTFGRTGYPYIMDSKGLLIIHPKLEGTNIYNSVDDSGRMFIKEVCEKKNGKIIYPWKNPGDKIARKKLVIFNYIPELDWIVASSGYLDEFYSPLKTIGMSTLLAAVVMLVLIVVITWFLSGMLAKPLQEMINVFKTGGQIDFSKRMEVKWGGEMDIVAENYNSFINKLQKTREKLLESEHKFRGIFENSIEGICRISNDGKLLTINPALAKIFGYDSTERMMTAVTDINTEFFKNPEDTNKIFQLLDKNDSIREYQVQMCRRDRSDLWGALSIKAYKTQENKLLYMDGFITDITDRKASEEALQKSHLELENRVEERTEELSSWVRELERLNTENALFGRMTEMIQVCTKASEIYKIANQFSQKFFPETSGRLFEYDKENNHMFQMASWGEDDGPEQVFSPEDCWALRQGKPYLNGIQDPSLYCTHLEDLKKKSALCVPMMVRGEILGLLSITDHADSVSVGSESQGLGLAKKTEIGTTIAEHIAMALSNIRLQESLKQKSIIDQLTGLFNRRFLDESLKKEAFRMVRHKYKIGIIMIDVDHFKLFNDKYGHDCGDAVLKSLGEFIKFNTRGEDIACRYGGEEFVVILINTSQDGLKKKAENICTRVREDLSVKHKDQTYKITISVGAALCPVHADTLEKTMETADEALYQAKYEGRDRACIAQPDKHAASE